MCLERIICYRFTDRDNALGAFGDIVPLPLSIDDLLRIEKVRKVSILKVGIPHQKLSFRTQPFKAGEPNPKIHVVTSGHISKSRVLPGLSQHSSTYALDQSCSD